MEASELFQERIVRIERAAVRYCLLVSPSGDLLAAAAGGKLATASDADDQAVWSTTAPGRYRHAVTGITLEAEPQKGDRRSLEHAGEPVGADGAPAAEAAFYTEVPGPERLPSEHLTEIRQRGWTCLAGILEPTVVDDLQALAGTDGHRKHARDPAAPSLCESAAVANAIAEPVSLWLARQYMQVAEIRLAHAPAVAVLPTDDGKRDLGKWHCDYPYHWGAGAASFVPTGTGETVLGVQRNVCISEFSKVRGATVFKLGSHALDKGPPDEWGTHSAYADPRFRAAHRVPYSGPEADVVEAPAGSILVYDARTWHRAGVNRTEQPRAAMILAHIPRYVMPKSNTGAQYQQFVASPIYQELNARQRLEMERLLVHRYVASNEPVDIG